MKTAIISRKEKIIRIMKERFMTWRAETRRQVAISKKRNIHLKMLLKTHVF